jgi:MFS family permease
MAMVRKWFNNNILGFGLASFWMDLSHEMITAALPSFVAFLSGTTQAPHYLGLISGLSDGMASFVKLISGNLSDKTHQRKIFVVCGYSLGSALSLIAFASNLWHVALCRTLSAIGKGLREPARDALIAESVLPRYYGRAFGFHRAMDTCGAILGPAAMLFLMPLLALRGIFLLSFLPALCAVLSILFLTKDSTKQQDNSSLPQEKHAQLPRHFIHFASIVLIFSLGNFNRMLLLLRVQGIMQKNDLQLTRIIILLYVLFNVIRACGEYGIGWLSDYINRTKILAIGGYALFSLTTLLLALPITSKSIMTLVFIIAALSTATVTALTKACAAEILPAESRGKGFAILQTIQGIGTLISSSIVGFLWTYSNPTQAFLYSTLLSLCATFSLYNLVGKQKGELFQ